MTVSICRALVPIVVLIFMPLRAAAGNWPQWRGPRGDGVSDESQLPVKWGENSNILWKCPLPDHGASTPAVWEDAVFVTAHAGGKLLLLRIDKTSGKVAWTRTVGESAVPEKLPPVVKKGDQRRQQRFNKLHNMASPSPVTDGEVIVVHFGNGDLAAYDFSGKQLWLRNLQKEHGTYTIWWGHANSPVLYKDLVVTVCMQDSLADLPGAPAPSYVVAHDKRTGAQKWKTMRQTRADSEECDSYTTPVFRATKERVEMIVMGANQLDAYDPATGQQLWVLPGIAGGRTVTGPTLAGDLVYATQGKRGPFLALRPGAADKRLPPEAVVWKQTQATPDTPCPVVWKDLVFWITDNGVVSCRDARTGDLHWKEKFSGDFKASPVAGAGKVYFLNLSGVCTVVAAQPRFEKLAENKVDDETIASLAASDGKIFLRGHKALYCLGNHVPGEGNKSD